MIDEKEMFSLLNRKVPELRRDIHCSNEKGCAYKMATFFAKFTNNLMTESKTDRIKECLTLAEDMLTNGDYAVKNSIENSYIFSISRVVSFDLVRKFPLISKEYNRQIYSRCI